MIDGLPYSDRLPYISRDIHVKHATSQFIAVTGFGFHILWDGMTTAYITLDPVFMNKVTWPMISWSDIMFYRDDNSDLFQ